MGFNRNPKERTDEEIFEYAHPLSQLYGMYKNDLDRLKQLVDKYPKYTFSFARGPGSSERYIIFRDGKRIHSGWVPFNGAINQIAYDAYGEGYESRRRWGEKKLRRRNPRRNPSSFRRRNPSSFRRRNPSSFRRRNPSSFRRRNPDPSGKPWGPKLYNPLEDKSNKFKNERHYTKMIAKLRRNPGRRAR
jgi:hypothetical protein